MDYIFEKCSKIPLVDTISNIDSANIVLNVLAATEEFYQLNLPLMVQQCSFVSQKTANILFSLGADVDSYEHFAFDNLFFSDASNLFVSDLRTALDSDLSPDAFQAALNAIYKSVIADDAIPPREQEQLSAILQIGISSCQYWSDTANQTKWSTLFTNTPPTISFRSIWKGDVAGAVGGAAWSLGVAIFGGPAGWAIFGGNCLGGALCASAIVAVANWIGD
ncbi:MAG: hypothetical protein WCG87_03640 [Bacteroidota bacterium]